MSYVNDERLANEALQWWQRYPDSVQALVSMLDDTATDEHGNVLGSVSWSHENGLEITLAGSNGLLYSTRKTRKDDGWHVFHLAADEKELQKRLKRRLQWSNEESKISSEMNTHSKETGNANMKTSNTIKNIARTIIEATSGNDLHSVGELLESIKDNIGGDFEVHHEGFDWRIIHRDDIDSILESELSNDEYILGCFTSWALADVLPMSCEKIEELQSNEAFEALGAMVVAMDKVGELAEILVTHDGYGHHFSSYDGETLEAGEYYVFNLG